MTVAELIEILQKHDENLPVEVYTGKDSPHRTPAVVYMQDGKVTITAVGLVEDLTWTTLPKKH